MKTKEAMTIERFVDGLMIIALVIFLAFIAKDIIETRKLKKNLILMQIELLTYQLEEYNETYD